jgi:hypothetical protein
MPIRQAPTSGYAGSITATAPSSGVTLDRGIAYGGGDSSTFFQDLADQDRREALQDEADRIAAQLSGAASAEGGFDQGEIDAVTALIDAGLVSVNDVASEFGLPASVVQAAYDANKPLGGTQDAYDAVLDAASITDTTGEYLEDIQAAIENEGIATENLQATTANMAGALDPNFTASQAAIAGGVGDLTTAKQNTKDAVDAALASGVVDQKDIEETFGPTLAETVLEGVGDVLSAGTGAIANVAGNVPVVGGALQDTVEGLADFFKETKGTASVNPITGQVTGTFGEIPPWMDKQTVTQIGTIPGSKTTAGVTTGTIVDDIISIGRGEQDIGDVLEDRTGQVASTIGIDPKILAAATAAGKTVKDYLEDEAKAATLAPEADTTTETEVKPVAVDLSGGADTVEGEEEDIVATLTEAEEKEKNLAIATQVFEDAGGGAAGTQAVLDALEENGLTTADLADLTGLGVTDINEFINTTLGNDDDDKVIPEYDWGSGDVIGPKQVVDGEDIVDTLTLGGGEWENDGADPEEEVISERIAVDGLTFEPPVPPEEPPLQSHHCHRKSHHCHRKSHHCHRKSHHCHRKSHHCHRKSHLSHRSRL